MLVTATEQDTYDYIIVGGGTAGCVIAARLSEYLPERKILLIEGGPSDQNLSNVLNLKEWLSVLEGELDYAYTTTPQPNGNSSIVQSRARVLGGCSSHNATISFRPMRHDLDRWVAAGATGWDFDTFMRLADKLQNAIKPVHPKDRNQLMEDWIQSSSKALGMPVIEDFNREVKEKGFISSGAGFLSLSYEPETMKRSSASVAYIHPILEGKQPRSNLTVLTEARVTKVTADGDVAKGVIVTLKSGEVHTLNAQREIILCAGAIDTPRLLLLSGIGPRKALEDLDIPVQADIPGVGENLMDHPEGIMMWELNKDVPSETVVDCDGAFFLREEGPDAAGNGDGTTADIQMLCYQVPFVTNLTRLGYRTPPETRAFCMTPNVPRSRSRGRVYLTSTDPSVKPALDFRYFTDEDGYDAKMLVAALKAARKVAEQEPFKSWIKEEVAPGPNVQSDSDISEYARRSAHTVYHPSGTTKMGSPADPLSVVDPELKVKHFKNLRVADAGVFPYITTVNPMVTVLCVGERAAEIIAGSDRAGSDRADG